MIALLGRWYDLLARRVGQTIVESSWRSPSSCVARNRLACG